MGLKDSVVPLRRTREGEEKKKKGGEGKKGSKWVGEGGEI